MHKSSRGQSRVHQRVVFPFLIFLVSFCGADYSLPFPSLVREIQPTLSIYSPSGNPKCFKLTGGGTATTRDIVALSIGQGAYDSGRAIFLVHGFKDNENSEWIHELKNALVEERAQTVVIVGWGGGADVPSVNYEKALANTRAIAIWLSEIVTELRRMRPVYIWGIGHNLGAHLLGLSGRASHGAFNRITALDPSGPFLETENLDMRLRRTDAPFIDVIHSDACSSETTPNCWVSPNTHYRTLVPLGTIDFYPNYSHIPHISDPTDIAQSHTRAIDLFLISIRNQGFFLTNEVLSGSPGLGQLIPTALVSVYAEMGYWADTAFIPGETDTRVNFYIKPDKMIKASRIRDSMKHQNFRQLRRKRDLADPIHCTALPSNAFRKESGEKVRIALVGIFSYLFFI